MLFRSGRVAGDPMRTRQAVLGGSELASERGVDLLLHVSRAGAPDITRQVCARIRVLERMALLRMDVHVGLHLGWEGSGGVQGSSFDTTCSSISGLNGLTIHPDAPAALPCCLISAFVSVVRIRIGTL